MYHFQSLFQLTICGTPEIRFDGYEYSTEDEKIAERLRRNSRFGVDLWETTPEVYKEKVQETQNTSLAVPKRRGRPPKVKIIDGARTSEVIEKKEIQE